MPTRRPHPSGGRCDDIDEPSSSEIPPHLNELCIDELTRHDAGNKHDATVGIACHTVTTGHEPLDVQTPRGADSCGEIGARHNRRP